MLLLQDPRRARCQLLPTPLSSLLGLRTQARGPSFLHRGQREKLPERHREFDLVESVSQVELHATNVSTSWETDSGAGAGVHNEPLLC